MSLELCKAAVGRRLHRVRLAIAVGLSGGLIIYLLTSSLGAELWQLLINPDPERFEQ